MRATLDPVTVTLLDLFPLIDGWYLLLVSDNGTRRQPDVGSVLTLYVPDVYTGLLLDAVAGRLLPT